MNASQKRHALLHTAVLSLSLSLSHPIQADGCRPTYILGNKTAYLPCVEWLPSNSSSTQVTPPSGLPSLFTVRKYRKLVISMAN
ncbi:hypothetical protein THII_1363 [Thioploca ingrica]|uniref:Secreted protein n=1 Tax=Thioploca ingrica TaxID=40754 RepID=A0A090AKS5_9GAMM|nr:hypothetical protein THII_1363 [Thioploca ingrica]